MCFIHALTRFPLLSSTHIATLQLCFLPPFLPSLSSLSSIDNHYLVNTSFSFFFKDMDANIFPLHPDFVSASINSSPSNNPITLSTSEYSDGLHTSPSQQHQQQQQQQINLSQHEQIEEHERNTEAQIRSQIQNLQIQLDAIRSNPENEDPTDFHNVPIPPSTSTSNSFKSSDPLTSHSPRLIVVSNRLPVTVSKTEDGEWKFRVSSGGLVSALAGVKSQIPFIWVGWTGEEVLPSDQDLMTRKFQDEMSCYPVFLSEEVANLYYNGFCNNILWPLFHYVPLPIVTQQGDRKFDAKYWDAYLKANHRFADAVMQVYRPGDIIWVQDYHLMVLPNLLRKRLPDVTIGFFLHTPFPSSEVYRILPVRNKILQGVLSADLIGFHTYDYAFHFLSVCTRILGLESNPKGVKYKDHFAAVATFPIGTDPDSYLAALKTEHVKNRIMFFENNFKGKKVLLGIDRLDYTKGIPHKLMAFELLLATQPQWKDNVVLIQIGVPSRTEVDEYKKLISQTNELVGRINGQYGTVGGVSPILFFNQAVSFEDLCALYAVADVLLVTPIRDGMNLVSYEYVVCQQHRHGVLVLSEFAGSAQSLTSAIRVNPWNIEELAGKMHEALTLPERERRLKHQRLFQYVKKHTAAYWAQTFVTHLQEIDSKKAQDKLKPMQSLLRVSVDILPEMRAKRRRLILIEYEGTLVEPVALPDLAFPSSSLLNFLHQLSCEPENFVYIISGRSKQVLENWFGEVNVGLICEHGCDFVHPGGEEWQSVVQSNSETWKDSVIPILQYFKERTPGAHLEIKKKTITWHFRDADPLFGSWQAKELQLILAESCVNLPVEVVSGPKYLELRPESVSRVSAIQRILSEIPDGIDFAFAIGSDKADEEVFSFLNDIASDGHLFTLTCRVGGRSDNSSAERYVPDSDVVFRVLKELLPPTNSSTLASGGTMSMASRRPSNRGMGLASGGIPSSAFRGIVHRRKMAGGPSVIDGRLLHRLSSVPRSNSYDANMTGINRFSPSEKMISNMTGMNRFSPSEKMISPTMAPSRLGDGQVVITAQSVSNEQDTQTTQTFLPNVPIIHHVQ